MIYDLLSRKLQELRHVSISLGMMMLSEQPTATRFKQDQAGFTDWVTPFLLSYLRETACSEVRK